MTDDRPNERKRMSDEELLSAVPSGTGGKEVRVGLFVILGLISFVTVLFWMTDPATFRGRYMLVTVVSNAGGVRAGDPIQMYGINIGRVHGFDLMEPGRVDITMEIEGEWQIPLGSRTRFGSAGIFGGRTLVIDPTAATQYHEEWDTLPGTAATGGGLLGSMDDLGETAGTVLERIEALLDAETVGSLRGSAGELEQLLTELSAITREQHGTLRDMTESLARSAEGIEDATAGPELARTIARADSAMSALSQTSTSLDAAATSLREVLARIDRGEGTLGRLATDESLYVSLNSAATSLNELLTDLQANPSKYINISIF